VLVLDAVRAGDKALVHKTSSANLFDIGDGVALVEFTSKMNSIDAGVLELLMAAPQLAQDKGFVALVIGNEGSNFSVGANLLEMLMRAKQSDWAGIEQAVRGFQDTLMGLRHAPLPVVAAAHGMALGGGLEVCLHTDHVQANAESYMGLVEFGVGLVPAGGGLKEIVRRASEWAEQAPNTEPYEPLRRGFENVTTAKVATSALEAREFGFLRPSDGVTFHKARVIADAKTKALALAAGGYVPPDPNEPIRVIGRDRGASFMMGAQLFQWGGYASEHDALIARKVAHILTGGMGLGSSTVTAQHLLDLEREAFVSLVAMEKTQARMETMLMTGKPLRN
jgi:3-hydroxyacyl-CoA dehydrogenase